jgi:hypothetical protein
VALQLVYLVFLKQTLPEGKCTLLSERPNFSGPHLSRLSAADTVQVGYLRAANLSVWCIVLRGGQVGI